MHPRSIIIIVLWSALCLTGRAARSEDVFLRAIREVETGDRANATGRSGERGAYQFRHKVWHQHTSTSFDLAFSREVATTVARRHLAWLQHALANAGITPSPRNLALAWNAGIGNVQRGSAPRRSYDYAVRVVNLMNVAASTEAEGAVERQALFRSDIAERTPSHPRSFTTLFITPAPASPPAERLVILPPCNPRVLIELGTKSARGASSGASGRDHSRDMRQPPPPNTRAAGGRLFA